MKIGIDARFYGEAGPGRYVAELLKNLEKIDTPNDYVVYLKSSNYESYQPQNPRFKKARADFHWYSLSEQMLFPLKLYRQNFDLVHFTQINVPLFYLWPFVVTVHDLILHEYSTERGHLLRRLLYRLKRLPYFLVFAKAVYLSKKILVPSQATKDDLLRYYRVDPSKIIVTHEAVDHYPTSDQVKNRLEVLEKYGIRKPYLLCLGSFYPHKNIPRLVRAFKLLRERGIFGGQLVLAGRKSYFSERLEELVRRENVPDVAFPRGFIPQRVERQGIVDVVFPAASAKGFYPRRGLNPIDSGYLPDSEVEVILANAFVYVQPALKEGFGLPPVEAMVFGVPTAVSNIACLHEMCREASLYFDPLSEEDMAHQLKMIIENGQLRKELVRRGYENIKRFSWSKMAQATLEVYNFQ